MLTFRGLVSKYLTGSSGAEVVNRDNCRDALQFITMPGFVSQTIINRMTRLSLVRIRSAPMVQGLPVTKAPFCNGLIWMIDMSIGLGTGKILTVLALNAHHHQLSPAAPGLQDVHCMAVSEADSWANSTGYNSTLLGHWNLC